MNAVTKLALLLEEQARTQVRPEWLAAQDSADPTLGAVTFRLSAIHIGVLLLAENSLTDTERRAICAATLLETWRAAAVLFPGNAYFADKLSEYEKL